MKKKIGHYDLIRVIGSGATSTVYLARDAAAQRDVAIKVAIPDILLKRPERGAIYGRLFMNEASLAGKLAHPHIVQILDADLTGEPRYIVMEYVPGGTIEECCVPSRLLSVGRIVEIVARCARALDFAHRHGVTHRDIKPANILYAGQAPNSEIKITDFGAAIVDHPGRTLVSGVGSLAYMSPEQLRELALDHRTDIYSLGVVMYQLLTGQLPFPADNSYDIISKILNTEPAPPSTLRETIPEALDAFVARALRKDAEERFATWEEFAHALAQAYREAEAPDQEQFEALRTLAFFADFPDAEIREVLRFAAWSTASPGQTVMRDGDAGDFFCFLLDGELRVTKRGHLLGLLMSGECFGEMSVIGKDQPPRGVEITALTAARIVTVRGEVLRHSSETCRMHFYQAFLEVLAQRLNLANARLAAL